MITNPLRGFHRLALYRVVSESGRLVTPDGEPFDAHTYSHFKYGDGAVTDLYAHRLANLLIEEHLASVRQRDEPLIVCGSAYKRVPTAAYHVAASAAAELRFAGLDVHHGHILRGKVAEGDYSAMTLAERTAKMRDNQLSLEASLFEGKHVVVVDDIHVTGQHEKSLLRLMEPVSTLSLTMAYIVELDPSVTRDDPQVESRINQTAIKNVTDLFWHIRSCESFGVTARIVKFVLDADYDDARWFIVNALNDLPHVIRLIYIGAVDDGYDRMSRYSRNFGLLADAERTRQQRVRDGALKASPFAKNSRRKPSEFLAKHGW